MSSSKSFYFHCYISFKKVNLNIWQTGHDLFEISGVPVWLNNHHVFETYTLCEMSCPPNCPHPPPQAALPHFVWQHFHHLFEIEL